MRPNQKPKKCKGIGKAHGFEGCGKLSIFRTYGLCPKCLSEWANETKEGEKFLSRQIGRVRKNKEKAERKKRAEEKKQNRDIKVLKSLLQDAVNEIARLVDAERGCVSCNHGRGAKFTRQPHGGHYKSVGSSNSIRYNLHNIHKQCYICNFQLGGNPREYYKGLVERYGEDYAEMVEGLKVKYPYIKLSRQEYEEALKIARQIIREIKKGTDFTREEVNKRLGIYGT